MEITTPTAPRSRRLSGLLLNIACAMVSALALLFIVPAAFGFERYAIAGGSMTGSISRGSVVFEENVPVADLRVGDVITYMPPADSSIKNLVTHRIHSIQADVFRTKGDANPDVDPWTFKLTSGTQPRVVAHVPGVGYLFLALQDRNTRMAVIGVPAALIALHSLITLLGGTRRRKSTPAKDAVATAVGPEPESTPAPVVAPRAAVLIPAQANRSTRRSTRRPTHVGR